MLSAKVIYAIAVLTALAVSRPNRQGRCILTQSDLALLCRRSVAFCRAVLGQLTRYEYLASLATGYTLLRRPDEISLYDLVELFHGDLVIGEICCPPAKKQCYRDHSDYGRLVRFESDLQEELTCRFRAIRISELVRLPR